MKVTPLIPSTLTVADSLVLERRDRSIVIKHLGIGNTAGDLVVYLPKEKLIATGDLVVKPVPFAFNAHCREWPTTLRALTRIDATTIVPGHGEVESDWSYVNTLIPLFEGDVGSSWEKLSRAEPISRRRARPSTSIRSVQRSAQRPETERLAFDLVFLNPGIESAYNQLKPDSTKK